MGVRQYILSVMKDERKTIDGRVTATFLSMISIAYLFLLKCAGLFYKTGILRRRRAPLKVISVGNITLGGTGKTPFTIVLAELLKKDGKKPAVLTRGYGNDESILLGERLAGIPVLVGRNRIKNAAKAGRELGSDCVILDDGFQHRAIMRDLDIVLIDAVSPFGNLKIFPRGVLREPLARLKDADIAVLTKSDMGRGNIESVRRALKKINEKMVIAESYCRAVSVRKLHSEENKPLTYISGKKAALLAGIADPDYFSWMVKNLGCEVAERFYFIDHYRYSEKDMASVDKRCAELGIKLVITTEKDAVRLRSVKNTPKEAEIVVLKIDFRINLDEETIDNRLRSVFNS